MSSASEVAEPCHDGHRSVQHTVRLTGGYVFEMGVGRDWAAAFRCCCSSRKPVFVAADWVHDRLAVRRPL
jgi:hypothetical protein